MGHLSQLFLYERELVTLKHFVKETEVLHF